MKRALLAIALIAACASMSGPAAAAQSLDRDISLQGATTVRLNVSGPIHLIASKGAGAIKLHVVDFGKTPPLTVRSSKTGRRLNVTVSGPSQSILPFVGASGYELQVTYPASLQLDVRQFAGSMHVDRVTAPMQLYNANGPIAVDEADSALTAQADLGDITVGSARGMVELTCGTGNVTATLDAGWRGNLVRMEASKGNLTLHVPARLRANFDLTSGSGSVKNPLRSTPHAPLVFMLTEDGNVLVAPSDS